ncbi:hypothetical protein TrCOL_g1915 [Triparma columacea]|uniref:Transmembrane protein n=1 Tax=Triparma columacea TaxID=722753 RepID=A0A9W7FUW9_9STRA|nr:hypothetical protein TrCOL_g1915 [Triparma columacea]
MHRALYHDDDDDYVPPSTNYDDADDDITSPSYILEWVFWYFVVPFIMGGLLRMMCKKKQEKEEEPNGWRINQVGDERSALQMPTEHDEEAPAVEPVEAPPPVMFTVTCPEDVEAGAEIVVQGPGGSVQVAVPEELGPDRMFLVQVPGKQPPRRMTVKKRDDNEEFGVTLEDKPGVGMVVSALNQDWAAAGINLSVGNVVPYVESPSGLKASRRLTKAADVSSYFSAAKKGEPFVFVVDDGVAAGTTEEDSSALAPPKPNRRFSARPSLMGEIAPMAKPPEGAREKWSTVGQNSLEVVGALSEWRADLIEQQKNSTEQSKVKAVVFGVALVICVLFAWALTLYDDESGHSSAEFIGLCFFAVILFSCACCYTTHANSLNRAIAKIDVKLDPKNVHGWIVDKELWTDYIELLFGPTPDQTLWKKTTQLGELGGGKPNATALRSAAYDTLKAKPVCTINPHTGFWYSMYAFNPKINRNKEPMESGRTGLKIPTRLMTIPAYGLVPTKSKGHILCYITEIKQNKCQVAHHIPLPRDRHEANQVLKEFCEIAGLDKTDYAGKTLDGLGEVVDMVTDFVG